MGGRERWQGQKALQNVYNVRSRTERHRIDPNGRFSVRFLSVFFGLAAFGPGFDASSGWDAEGFSIGKSEAGLSCLLGTSDGDGEVVGIIFVLVRFLRSRQPIAEFDPRGERCWNFFLH